MSKSGLAAGIGFGVLMLIVIMFIAAMSIGIYQEFGVVGCVVAGVVVGGFGIFGALDE
jgi:hypothetical protein